jgi:predicted  nucleic acid-binding Zn-ribbon protein
MRASCPACGHVFQSTDSDGQPSVCPKCGAQVSVTPSSASDADTSIATGPPAEPRPAGSVSAPAARKLSPAIWIGGAIACGLASCLLCAGVGVVGARFFIFAPVAVKPGPQEAKGDGAKNPPAVAPGREFVGRWNMRPGNAAVEFRSDGRGHVELGLADHEKTLTKEQLAEMGIKDGIHRRVFEWRLENGQDGRAVLVLEGEAVPHLRFDGDFALFSKGRRNLHFTQEQDTLTLKDTRPHPVAKDEHPKLILHRLK